MLSTTSVLGETVIDSSLYIEVLITKSFSRRVQSFSRAFSMAAVVSGEVSLYKYRIKSSGA
jgi:hypothetical protein